MKDTDDFMPQDNQGPIRLSRVGLEGFVDELIKQKDRLMFQVLEVIEGKVPNADDVMKHGSIRRFPEDATKEMVYWKGQPVLLLNTIKERTKDGRILMRVIGESPFVD